MRELEVSCAFIEEEGLALVAQRNEFMRSFLTSLTRQSAAVSCGVSLPPGNSHLRGKLGVDITISFSLSPSDWQYPDFAMTLFPFVCGLDSDEMFFAEHKCRAWVKPEELPDLDWAEADIPVVNDYLTCLREC